jgi:hypothetical protein
MGVPCGAFIFQASLLKNLSWIIFLSDNLKNSTRSKLYY